MYLPFLYASMIAQCQLRLASTCMQAALAISCAPVAIQCAPFSPSFPPFARSFPPFSSGGPAGSTAQLSLVVRNPDLRRTARRGKLSLVG